jgi:hypothetical protein
MHQLRKYGLRMIGVSTTVGMKRVRAALVGLLTLLFVVAPMLDSLLCSGEVSAAEISLIDDGAHDAPQPLNLGTHSDCFHGHCHHFVPMAPESTNYQSPGNKTRNVAWLSTRMTSVAPSSLERPPRI